MRRVAAAGAAAVVAGLGSAGAASASEWIAYANETSPFKLVLRSTEATGTSGLADRTITGIGAAQQLIGIDFDVTPGEERLLAVTREGTIGRLYEIRNPLARTGTAEAVRVGIGTVPPPFAISALGNSHGVDYDPITREVVIMDDANNVARVDARTGQLTFSCANCLDYDPSDVNGAQEPDVAGLAILPSGASPRTQMLDHSGFGPGGTGILAELSDPFGGDAYEAERYAEMETAGPASSGGLDFGLDTGFDAREIQATNESVMAAVVSGGVTRLYSVSGFGSFQFPKLVADESLPNMAIVPAGSVSINDFTGVTVREGDVGLVRLQREENLLGSIRVSISCSAAQPGASDTPCPVSTEIADGDAVGLISVGVPEDTVVEPTRAYSVDLIDADGGAVALDQTSATVTIVDDDAAHGAADAAVAEAAGPARVRIAREGYVGEASSVTWTTANGSAVAGTDYVAASGTALFPAGARSVTVAVPLVDDATPETDKTFKVVLGGQALDPDRDEATVTILDDDPAPVQTVTTTVTTPGSTTTVPGGGGGGSGDDAPPTVAFASPAAGAQVGPGAVTVALTAGDDRGVARVVLIDDDKIVAEDTTAPYAVTWTPAAADVGRNTLTAMAVDTAGQTASARRPVVLKRLPATLTLASKPARDRAAPFRFALSGKVAPPKGTASTGACADGGRVTLTVRSAAKAPVRVLTAKVSAACTYKATLALPRAPGRLLAGGRLGVTPAFSGNAALAPAAGRVLRVRLG